ncbi:hypothetical protein DID88_001951 [Monilinia fructigena]|uniref:Actin n=1 Tax=Monilinia fructigena TaxID=38457 RepID=A0A395IVZ5_9HELO|nr:hypothetical protein DID88_001951 [Monilinia fructigena]
MADTLHNAPIVLDNGSGTIRAGFAGEDLPKITWHSYRLDDMERIWEYVYGEGLKTLSEEHPVLLTEPPLNPRSNRDTAAQILFETFNVPALYTSIQAVLRLYASGRNWNSLDAAMESHMQFQLDTFSIQRREGGRKNDQGESELCGSRSKTRRKGMDCTKLGDGKIVEYALPDGNKIKIGAERFRAPEILFDPEIIDLDLRKSLFGNIVLSGGSTLTKGFGDRLLHEVQRLAVKDMRIKIFAPPERKYSTWIGGSILAGLSTFRKMWVSIDDWHENPDIIHTKLHNQPLSLPAFLASPPPAV